MRFWIIKHCLSFPVGAFVFVRIHFRIFIWVCERNIDRSSIWVGLLFSTEVRVRILTDYHLIEIQVAKQCDVDNRTAALWRRV